MTNCKDCKWFRGDGLGGNCFRVPPTPVAKQIYDNYRSSQMGFREACYTTVVENERPVVYPNDTCSLAES